MKKAPLFWLCLSALSAVGESQVNAQAYCALRDPVSVIRRYNPESDGYRSLVGKVTAGVREQVSERLPFTIHLKELGAHTLYLASRAGVPETLIHVRSEKGRWGLVEIAWIFDIDLKVKGFVFQRCRDRNREVAESEAVQAQFAGKGYGVPETLIHVRSEKGRWGLVEIAWIFDIDLKVKGFVFQRCRDRNREVAESEAVQAQFAGKGFAELRSLLTEDGSRLRPGALDLASGAGDLAETLVRSALKTIAVTEIVWPEELRQMRLQVGATAPGR